MRKVNAYQTDEGVVVVSTAPGTNIQILPPDVFAAAYAAVYVVMELGVDPYIHKIKLIKSTRAATEAGLAQAKHGVELAIEALRQDQHYQERTKHWKVPTQPQNWITPEGKPF